MQCQHSLPVNAWHSPQAWCTHVSAARRLQHTARPGRRRLTCRAESKEYYDYKDMPPLPMTVKRISIPKLDYTVVDKDTENLRMASLAIFYDICKDSQYQ